MMMKNLVVALALFSSLASAKMVSVNGALLEVEIKGNGTPVVFFDAGALSGLEGWDAIWDKLPKDITAIRYARRGEGNSSACQGDLSGLDYVRDTEALINKLGITKPFVYVSHSYGGRIARLYTARNPKMVASMLFADPINPKDVDIVTTVDPVNGPIELAQIKKNDLSSGQFCFIKDIWDKNPEPGFTEMGDIKMTLIAGVKYYEKPSMIFLTDAARDLWGQEQAKWVQQFPRGKIVYAKKSGHMVVDDQPDLVLNELVELLK